MQTEKTSPGTSFFWLSWNDKERIKVWLAKLRLVHPPAKTARICQQICRGGRKMFVLGRLNLHRRGAGLVCYSVTFLEYKSACRAVYAIPLSHISDIRELGRNLLESDRELYFKRPINIHGKLPVKHSFKLLSL